MRHDSVGLFWQDVRTERGRSRIQRVMPAIPETGWRPPTEFPDLRGAPAISVDVETYDPELDDFGPGWARHRGHIVGIGIGTSDGYRNYFPIRHEIQKELNLDPETVLRWAKAQLETPMPKIGANLTYDVGWLREEGINVGGELHDVQFAEALLEEEAHVALDVLAWKYLREHKRYDVLYEWCAAYYGGNPTEKQRRNIYRAPITVVGPYGVGDIDLPFRIIERQWGELHRLGLYDVYRMECRLIRLMIEMRFAGVSIDLLAAEELRAELLRERQDMQGRLNQVAGFDVNVNAAEHLARVFDAYGIPYPRTEKTKKPSFRAAFLESIDHPIGQQIRDVRMHDKIIGTFIDSYILNSHIDSKLYGQFHQLKSDDGGARSGRYSSSDPNLQNIPIRTKLGKRIRRLFRPDYGHLNWFKDDYSQIEYRFLAHFAVGPQSDVVRDRYRVDPRTDFHKMTQALIKEMTGVELARGDTKNTNFGLIYGMGIAALSARLGLTVQQGKKLFASYHQGAPFVKATMDATSEEAARLGFITTILGRRSRFELWEPTNWYEGAKALPYELAIRTYPSVRRAYLHKALNRRLQGSAADLIKAAMLQCWESGVFYETGVPRLTVHDELDFSNPGGKDKAFAEMRHILETAIPIRVPVKVSHEVGPNWGDVEEVET